MGFLLAKTRTHGFPRAFYTVKSQQQSEVAHEGLSSFDGHPLYGRRCLSKLGIEPVVETSAAFAEFSRKDLARNVYLRKAANFQAV